MASYNQHTKALSLDLTVQSGSRVYINPNFQKSNTIVPNNGPMYVNPQFHQYSKLTSSVANKPKIYVNPNFVHSNAFHPSVNNHNPVISAQSYSAINVTATNYHNAADTLANQVEANFSTSLSNHYYPTSGSTVNCQLVNSRNNTLYTSRLHLPNVTPNILPQRAKVSEPVLTKSRYSIVRQNNNALKKMEYQAIANIAAKIKINKYKTVTIDHAKQLQTEKGKLALNMRGLKIHDLVTADKYKQIISHEFIQSRFKLNRTRTVSKIEIRPPDKRKQSLNTSKVLQRSNQKAKPKLDKLMFRKNNIPCALFKKFGTCLRNVKGKCEYLHDKKHVSICRKFLKGICFNKDCLLSHEVSVKKMPTCSFYLKGMCTKEDCPYLHVKLNEKTKICLDFLKGYCEKGDKCSSRHVNVCPDEAMKGTLSRKHCSYAHQRVTVVSKMNKGILNQSIKCKMVKKINKKMENNSNTGHNSEQLTTEETKSRYYKSTEDSIEDVEVIKPTRCKLGTLPSFIQL